MEKEIIINIMARFEEGITDLDAFPKVSALHQSLFVALGLHASQEKPLTIAEMANQTGDKDAVITKALPAVAGLLALFDAPLRIERIRIPTKNGKLFGYFLKAV